MKSQIIEFNRLLEQQARMMHQIHPCAVTALSSSNGSHVQPSKAAFLLIGSLIFIFVACCIAIFLDLLYVSYNASNFSRIREIMSLFLRKKMKKKRG